MYRLPDCQRCDIDVRSKYPPHCTPTSGLHQSDGLRGIPSRPFRLYRLISDYTVTKELPKTDTLLFSRTIDPWVLCEMINVTVDTLYFLIFDMFLNLDFTINEISWDFTQDLEFMKLRDLGLEAGFKVPSVIFI